MLIIDLEKAWNKLEKITIDSRFCIEEAFIVDSGEEVKTFNKGESIRNIWYWLEEQNKDFLVAIAMGIVSERRMKQYEEAKKKERNAQIFLRKENGF